MSNITKDRFMEIFNDDSIESDWDGCNALQGLIIINNYLPNTGICGAEHDIIFSAEISKLIDAGITEIDVIRLRELNWMTEERKYLACFV